MPIPEYLRRLRSKIGHEMVYMCGVMAVVTNDAGDVLIQRRKDDGKWGLPGGIMEPGEEPGPATIREVLEETGIESIADRIIGIYAGAEQFVHYPNGDDVFFFQFVVACHAVNGQAQVNDDESLEVCFVPLHAVPEMERSQSQYIRLALTNNPRTDFRVGDGNYAPIMPMPDYINKMRERVGHEVLIVIRVSAVIINEDGQILLGRDAQTGNHEALWQLPGGMVDPGEEPANAAIRHIRQQIGMEIVPERVTGIYSGPEHQMVEANGDVSSIMEVIFACRAASSTKAVKDITARYFPPGALPSLSTETQLRIEHALGYDDRAYFTQ